jgi:hypothetical protein
MNPDEWTSWVRTETGKMPPGTPSLGNYYWVPNTIITAKHPSYKMRTFTDTLLKRESTPRDVQLTHAHYHVEYVTSDSIASHFPERPEVFGFLYMGHGAAEVKAMRSSLLGQAEYGATAGTWHTVNVAVYTGEIFEVAQKISNNTLGPQDIKPPHKLGLIEIWACGSAFARWEKLASQYGTWRLYAGSHHSMGTPDWHGVTGTGPDTKPSYSDRDAIVNWWDKYSVFVPF